jgi:hypothetical protein
LWHTSVIPAIQEAKIEDHDFSPPRQKSLPDPVSKTSQSWWYMRIILAYSGGGVGGSWSDLRLAQAKAGDYLKNKLKQKQANDVTQVVA